MGQVLVQARSWLVGQSVHPDYGLVPAVAYANADPTKGQYGLRNLQGHLNNGRRASIHPNGVADLIRRPIALRGSRIAITHTCEVAAPCPSCDGCLFQRSEPCHQRTRTRTFYRLYKQLRMYQQWLPETLNRQHSGRNWDRLGQRPARRRNHARADILS